MQGMQNQILTPAFWQIWVGDKQETATHWLQALGTDAIVVSDKNSRDSYRGDFRNPEKFQGLPVLFDDRQGTVIYRIPRTYPGIGRVVNAQVLESVAPIRGGDDEERLSVYAGEVEKAGRAPVNVQWKGFDEVRIRAVTSPGESVLLQETWDPAWVAEESGKRLEIRKDPALGFMLIPVSPGSHEITMHFDTPLENRIGQVLSVLSVLLVAGLVWRSRG